jgi:hypothetical protein
MIHPPLLAVGQKFLSDHRRVVAGQKAGMAEIPLPFAGLFGKYMTQILLLVLYLAGPGKRESFGGAFFGFHFWHDAIPY